MIISGIALLCLWMLGFNSEFNLNDIDAPILAFSMLFMVKFMKQKDKIIENQGQIIDLLKEEK